MTTIAADLRRGLMCSDSYWTDGRQCGLLRKVVRVRGELLGFAGHVAQWERWLETWKTNPLAIHAGAMRHCDVVVLHMNDAALMTWDATNGWSTLRERRYAIGTGSDAARGAMRAGASCRESIAIAATIDAETRGPVRSYRL